MVEDAIVVRDRALAEIAAAELVSAAGAARWQWVKDRVSGWVRRYRPELASITDAELDVLRCVVLIAQNAGYEHEPSIDAWRGRLVDLTRGAGAAGDALGKLLEMWSAPGRSENETPADSSAGDPPWLDSAAAAATSALLEFQRSRSRGSGAAHAVNQLRCLLLKAYVSLHANDIGDVALTTRVVMEIHQQLIEREPAGTHLAVGLAGLGPWLPESVVHAEGPMLADAMLALMQICPVGPDLDPKARVFGDAAAGLYRRMAAGDLAGYGPRLAVTQFMVSELLERLGLIDEAVRAIGETCDVWRLLLAESGATYQAKQLDLALGRLHGLRLNQNEVEYAAAASAEWVELHRRFAADPDWPAGIQASALVHHGDNLLKLNRPAAAVLLLREAADELRQMAGRDPSEFESILAVVLMLLREALQKTSRMAEALAANDEVISILSRLASEDLTDGYGRRT
jgi:hypothetical protein